MAGVIIGYRHGGGRAIDKRRNYCSDNRIIILEAEPMTKTGLVVATAVLLTGCNVVPPLDCVMGVQRPGCHRDANGMYGYLYNTPLTPNPYAAPVSYPPATPEVVYVPPPAPPAPILVLPPAPQVQQRPPVIARPTTEVLPSFAPSAQPAPYQQPVVLVSPDGQPIGVSQ